MHNPEPFLTITIARAPFNEAGFVANGVYSVRRAGVCSREAWGPKRSVALRRLLSIFRANSHGGKHYVVADPVLQMQGRIPEPRRGYRAARRSALLEAATAQAAML